MSLNESPSEKEGKYYHSRKYRVQFWPLNESPSEKEGKFAALPTTRTYSGPQ